MVKALILVFAASQGLEILAFLSGDSRKLVRQCSKVVEFVSARLEKFRGSQRRKIGFLEE